MLKCKIVAIDPGIQRGSGFLPDPNEASEDPSKNPPQKILQLGIDFKNAEVKKKTVPIDPRIQRTQDSLKDPSDPRRIL